MANKRNSGKKQKGGKPVSAHNTPEKKAQGGHGGGGGGDVGKSSTSNPVTGKVRTRSGGSGGGGSPVGVKTKPVPGNKVPDNYVIMSEEDVLPFYDYYHTILDTGRKKLNKQFRDPHHSKRIVGLSARVLSSSVTQEPVIAELQKDFQLRDAVNSWCCFGKEQWNGRGFAHGLSTNFSSPGLCAAEEKLAGVSVDFISDWANIKTLFKAHGSDTHLSYLLHRVGDSVTIDHLDLTSVMLFKDFLQLPPEFISFIKEIMGDNRDKIYKEGKSNKEVMAKEAFHKLLHASMKRQMKVDFSKEKVSAEGTCNNQFLHHAEFTLANKFKILAGSDSPIFTSEADEASLTVRSINGSISSLDALDLWLDNILLKCPRSLISYQKDFKITKTQWIKTGELPDVGKLDLGSYMEYWETLLTFLKESVKPGCSYWLYRAPGSCHLTLYNLSNIAIKLESNGLSSAQPIFVNWPLLKPYLPFFGGHALTKYSEYLSEAITDKLISETVYEPPDAASIMEEIINNNNNNEDPSAVKLESNSKTVASGVASVTNHKLQKVGHKLEILAKNVLKYLSSEESAWVIQSMDEINSKCFNRAVNCIKGIYSTAAAFTPFKKNYLYHHAVQRYFTMCIKLLHAIGPSNERFGSWETNERPRQFMICFCEGIMDVLTFLSDLHGQVNVNDEFKSNVQRVEWMYLACRMNIMNADTFGSMTRKVYEKMRVRMPADASPPPAEHHETIIHLYEKAAEQVPNEKCFRVERCFAISLKEQIIKQEELVGEINRKISLAYLDFARYQLTFPSFLFNVIGLPDQQKKKITSPICGEKTSVSPVSRDGEDIDPSALISPEELTRMRIKANNDKIQTLLEKCLEHADKVQLAIDSQLKSVKVTANTVMGQLKALSFQLELADHGDFGEKMASEIQPCFEINTCEGALELCNGRNDYDHSKTATSVFKEKPVSDAPVVLVRNFARGEAVSEAQTYFSRARDLAENPEVKSKLNLAVESLLQQLQYLKMADECQEEKPNTIIPPQYVSEDMEAANLLVELSNS